MRKIFTLLPLTAALLLTGCVSLAPDYERPQAPVEEAWPQDEAVKNAKLLTEGLADWASFFTDARLKKLIEQGLAQNRSLRSAFYSVEEARAQYGVSRAELFPSVAAAAGESAARSVSRTGSSINRTYSATAMASYELDLFGRVRNLNEMALQAFFQTQAAQRTVQMTVITDIAQTWLALGASKMQYKLARETLTSQEESYRLIVRSYELGASSQLDVQQAAQTVAAAQAAAVQAERAVSQYRNALRLLVGGTYDPALEPEGIETATVAAVSVAGNIPSEVLLNRPDIAQAEAVCCAQPTPISALRVRRFSRVFRSPELSGAAARSSPTSLITPPRSGAGLRRFRCPSSRAAQTSPTSERLRRGRSRRLRTTRRRFRRPLRMWPMLWRWKGPLSGNSPPGATLPRPLQKATALPRSATKTVPTATFRFWTARERTSPHSRL